MSLRRVAWIAAMFVAIIFEMSCGEVYRPVVIPIANNPPNPQNFHAVFGISNNVAPNPGAALQIDVSGDSNIGQANMGINPTHAATLPNNSRVFVTSAGSIVTGTNGQLAGYPDIITAFTPAAGSSIATGLGSPTIFTLPNTGPNQSSAISAISEAAPTDPDPNLVTVTLPPGTSLPQAAAGGQIIISGVVIQGLTGPNVSLTGAFNGNFTILSAVGNTITYDDCVPNSQPAVCKTGLSVSPLIATGGTASVPLPTFCSYQPNFVTTTQTTAMYVANYGVETPGTGSIPLTPNCNLPSTDSVAALNVTNNTITNIKYLPAASHPILMAETPNGQNLYVVTQGDGATVTPSVLNLSTIDLSTMGSAIPIGANPAWIASRPDGQQIYVVTAGDGMLNTINTVGNTLTPPPQPVGIGANYILYDKSRNRLYVTSPAATVGANGLVSIFSAAGPSPLGTVAVPAVPECAAAPATCGPVIPVSVAALADGSRFYVASYQTQSPCSDPNAGTGSCIIPMVTVFDAGTLTIRSVSSSIFGSTLSLFTSPPFATGQYAVPEVAACRPPAAYSPSSTRFRLFATASSDSSHVYVSICDAGAIASITTTTNTVSQGTNQSDRLVIDLLAPLSAGSISTGNQTPPQSPVFLLTGQ